MNILEKRLYKQLSFPDCDVEKMEINLEQKVITFYLDQAYLLKNDIIVLKDVRLIIQDWKNLIIREYISNIDTKKWINITFNNIEPLNEICEFNFTGKNLTLAGFGKTKGWLEFIFKKIALTVEYSHKQNLEKFSI